MGNWVAPGQPVKMSIDWVGQVNAGLMDIYTPRFGQPPTHWARTSTIEYNYDIIIIILYHIISYYNILYLIIYIILYYIILYHIILYNII